MSIDSCSWEQEWIQKMELTRILNERAIISADDIRINKPENLHGFQIIEKQTDNAILHIAYIDYRCIDSENVNQSLTNLLAFREELEKGERLYNLYIFFNDWEQERKVFDFLLNEGSNARIEELLTISIVL